MPRRLCASCKKTIVVAQKDWKYQHSGLDFFCSKKCLVNKIKSCYKDEGVINPDWRYDVPEISDVNCSACMFYSNKLDKYFRSEFEGRVAEYLQSIAIDFLYEPYCFSIGKYTYTPDFYIPPPYDCFLEVKGEFAIRGKTKLTEFKLAYPDVNFIFIPWTMRSEFEYSDPHFE